MRSLDDEREYLEGLLNTRFNYYLVFVSLIMVAGFSAERPNSEPDAFIFGFGFVVSALLAYSVGRTRALLQVVLNIITGTGAQPEAVVAEPDLDKHPYRIAYKALDNKESAFRFNANTIIVLTAALVTLTFLGLAIRAAFQA